MTAIQHCDCLGCPEVVVKMAGAKTASCPKWEIPWYNRNLGAKFQDALYGIGMRLHNQMVKAGKKIGWCCTVCGRQKLA